VVFGVEAEAPFDCIFPALEAHRVVAVLDCVFRAPFQHLGDFDPPVSELLLSFEKSLVFIRSPLPRVDRWVELVEPTLKGRRGVKVKIKETKK